MGGGLTNPGVPADLHMEHRIWEWIYDIAPDPTLPLDFRRGRILSGRLQQPPINPARIEAILGALVGVPVAIHENIAPYMFEVQLDQTGTSAVNLHLMYKLLGEIKPSHLSVGYTSKFNYEDTVTITAAAFPGVTVKFP